MCWTFAGKMAKLALRHAEAGFTYGQLASFPLHLEIERGSMRSIHPRASRPPYHSLACARMLGIVLVGLFSLQAAAQTIVNEPKLRSSSVLVVDQNDSKVIYSRNPDVASPIASITKLMTALV